MRHRKAGTTFGRKTSHRIMMFKHLTDALIRHELIQTTVTKAKELRRFAEPLITISKTDTVENRRLVFDRVRNKETVKKLFEEIGPRYKERPGGYLRVLKNGYRAGDSAPMAVVELVDRGTEIKSKKAKPKADAPKIETPAANEVAESAETKSAE